MTPAPDSTSAFSLPPGETPLGIQNPLGLSLLQPKFLTPLGAQPLTVLNPSTFSSLRETEASDQSSPFQDSPFFDAPASSPPREPAVTRSAGPSVQAVPLPNPPRNPAPAIANFPAEVATSSAPVDDVPDHDASSETAGWEVDPDVEAIAPPDSTPAIQAFSDSPVPSPAVTDSAAAFDAVAPLPADDSAPVVQAFSESPTSSPAIAPATSTESAPGIQAFSDSSVPTPAIADPPPVSDAIARVPDPDIIASDVPTPEPTRFVPDPAEVSPTVDPSVTLAPFTDSIAAIAPSEIPPVTPAAASPAIARAPLPETETRQVQTTDLSQTSAALFPDVPPVPQPATVPDSSDPLPDLSPALEPAAVEADSSESPTQVIAPLNSAAASPIAVESAPASVQAAAIAQTPATESTAASEPSLTVAADLPQVEEPATAPGSDMAAEPEADPLPVVERADAPAAADGSVPAEPDQNLSNATSPSEPSLQLKADPAPGAVSPFSEVEASLPASPDLEPGSPAIAPAAAKAAPAVPTESGLSSEELVQRSPAPIAAPTPLTELSETARPSTLPLDEFPAAAPDGISQGEPTRTPIQADLPQTQTDFSPPTLQRAEVPPEPDADGEAIAAIQPSSLPDLDRSIPIEASEAQSLSVQPSEVAEPAAIIAEPSASSPPSESTIQRAALPELEIPAAVTPTPTAETADLTSAPSQVQPFQDPEPAPELPDTRPDAADIAVSEQAPVLQPQAEPQPAASSPTLETAAATPTVDWTTPAPELSLGADPEDHRTRTPAPTPEPAFAVDMPTIQAAVLPTDTASSVSDAPAVPPAPQVPTEVTDTPPDVSTSHPPIPELPSVIQRLSVWEPLVQAQPLGAEVPLFQAPVIQRVPAPESPSLQPGGSDRNPSPDRSDSAPNGYQVPVLNSSGSATPDSWSSIAELLSASGASGSNGPTSSSNSSGASTPDSWSNIAELASFNSPAAAGPAIAPSSGYSELQLYPEPPSTSDLQTSPADTIQRNQASPVAMPVAPSESATQSAGESTQAANASPEALETLALEIYRLVLQRLALERERLGHTHSGRLPW